MEVEFDPPAGPGPCTVRALTAALIISGARAVPSNTLRMAGVGVRVQEGGEG
jgi:hypothetical protein